MGCVPFDPDFGCDPGFKDLPPDLQERATALAWASLRGLSGLRVGNCPVTVRPCLTNPCSTCRQWWWTTGWGVQAQLRDGEWSNCICCAVDSCSCEPMCEIVVAGPVAILVSVELDGCELPLERFRVDDGNRIVRQDGHCWPSCQNMTRPLGERGTFGITYVAGIIPDEAGLWAAGVLASEFAKACAGDKCRLPSAVTTIARQGVAMTMPGTMFEGGQTGIREVDAYILSVNPKHLTMPATVWTPDVSWAKHRYSTPLPKVTPT